MNNKLSIFMQREHIIRDIFIPLTGSFLLVLFVIWLIIVSLTTSPGSSSSDNTQTITNTDSTRGGDNS